jgi:hypothetical protein
VGCLDFAKESHCDGLKGAIFLTRYALVHQLCIGKSVPDLDCGEGFQLVVDWGAGEVAKGNVPAEALACALFATPKIDYQVADARDLIDLFPREALFVQDVDNVNAYLDMLDRVLGNAAKSFLHASNGLSHGRSLHNQATFAHRLPQTPGYMVGSENPPSPTR